MADTEKIPLLREARWLLLVACALYFAVALYGYTPADPAWSHSASNATTFNPAGVLGAYIADLLFYLFGFSAWWWVLFMLQRVMAGYPRDDSIFDRRALWVAIAGFMLLLLASSALEAVRLYSLKMTLPLANGGMMGLLIGDALTRLFGWTFGSALSFAVGASSSAPGQVPIEDLNTVLAIVQKAIAAPT